MIIKKNINRKKKKKTIYDPAPRRRAAMRSMPREPGRRIPTPSVRHGMFGTRARR
jgi:hypothetical protein